MVVSNVLLENLHHYPCLDDPERAARYCDHASPWWGPTASGAGEVGSTERIDCIRLRSRV